MQYDFNVPERVATLANVPERVLSMVTAGEKFHTTVANVNMIERVSTQAVIGQEKAVYKEISKGIILHKIQMPLQGAHDGADMKYIFKVRSTINSKYRSNLHQSRKSIS